MQYLLRKIKHCTGFKFLMILALGREIVFSDFLYRRPNGEKQDILMTTEQREPSDKRREHYTEDSGVTAMLQAQLLNQAERFACTTEMATFLAIMSCGGPQRFLYQKQEWDETTRHTVSSIHHALAQGCQDDLEFALKLYGLWAEFGQCRASIWANALYIHNELFEQEVRPLRERLLSERSVNKKEVEQRQLNFCLLDKVRIIIAYHLATETSAPSLQQAILVKPEWREWLQQPEHSIISMARFIIQQTRDRAEPPAIDEAMVKMSDPELLKEDLPLKNDELSIPPNDASHGFQSVENEVHLAKYHIGDWVRGRVTNVKDFGIFVEIEPQVYGLVHKSKMWGSIEDVRDSISIDEFVDVIIFNIKEDGNLELSMLYPEQDPLLYYAIDDEVEGIVTDVQPYGAFVEIEPQVYGLIHKSKMWGYVEDARKHLLISDEIVVRILNIDYEKRVMELSMQIPKYDPLNKYQPGDIVIGKVITVYKYGVIVEVEAGMRGLIHQNDMPAHIVDVRNHFTVGDEVPALIVSVDREKRRLSLNTKEIEEAKR
jgi:predicted RNA-binding protein with RPS1 domain